MMNSIDLLLKRQSNPKLKAPAPSETDLDLILQAGMRVPDHGALSPWHFTLVKEQGLQRLADIYVAAATADNADEVKLAKAAKMPFRAPLVIAVSTKFSAHPKVPKQEQLVATGCCVHAMQMAAYVLGYGAMWRTGDYSYHPTVKKQLQVSAEDEIIGFLYIGTLEKQLPYKEPKPYKDHVSYL
jgi:nitroreductase